MNSVSLDNFLFKPSTTTRRALHTAGTIIARMKFRQGAQVHHFVIIDQRRSDEAGAVKTHVIAQRNGRMLRSFTEGE